MNQRQLRYILEIAKQGNLTSASKALYISQPSLSNLLEHVEQELDLRLFVRKPTGMVLTPAGEYYVAAAQQILGCLADLDQKLSGIRDGQRGKLAIGCSQQKSARIFSHIVPVLRKKHPLYQFSLVEDAMKVLAEMLKAGELDAAFLYSNYQIDHVRSIPLYWEEVFLIAPEEFRSDRIIPQAPKPALLSDLSVVERCPFVLFKGKRNLRRLADEIFQKNGISPPVILETDSWQTCLSMVESDGAFSLLPFSPSEITSSTEPTGSGPRFQLLVPGEHYFRQLMLFYREGLQGTSILEDLLSACAHIQ